MSSFQFGWLTSSVVKRRGVKRLRSGDVLSDDRDERRISIKLNVPLDAKECRNRLHTHHEAFVLKHLTNRRGEIDAALLRIFIQRRNIVLPGDTRGMLDVYLAVIDFLKRSDKDGYR